MEASIIPQEVLETIGTSRQLFGQFDLEGKKYVFCPNTNNRVGLNPTHILEMGIKIGKIVMEKKIWFQEKVFLSRGVVSRQGGEITVLIYKVVEGWTKDE